MITALLTGEESLVPIKKRCDHYAGGRQEKAHRFYLTYSRNHPYSRLFDRICGIIENRSIPNTKFNLLEPAFPLRYVG